MVHKVGHSDLLTSHLGKCVFYTLDPYYDGLYLQSELCIFAVCKDSYVVYACGLTERENENDSANQNDVAK